MSCLWGYTNCLTFPVYLSLASLKWTESSLGRGGGPCLISPCTSYRAKPRDIFSIIDTSDLGNTCPSTDWLNRLKRRMAPRAPWPLSNPEARCTPSGTTVLANQDANVCQLWCWHLSPAGPSYQPINRRALRHQDVSLTSHKTWVGYKPGTGKGWPYPPPIWSEGSNSSFWPAVGSGTVTQASSWQIPVIKLWSDLIRPTRPPPKLQPSGSSSSWAKGTQTGMFTFTVLLQHPDEHRSSPLSRAGHSAKAGPAKKALIYSCIL